MRIRINETDMTKEEYQKLLAKDMSEEALVTNIINTARSLGYFACHFRPAINRRGRWMTAIQGSPGFPDVIVIGYGQAWLWECKTENGKVTPEQEDWLDIAAKAGFNTGIVRPHDWLNGDVEKELLEAKL